MQRRPTADNLFLRIAQQVKAVAEAQAAAQAAMQPRAPVAPKVRVRPPAPAAVAPPPPDSAAPPVVSAPPLLAAFRSPSLFLGAFVLAEALGAPVALRRPEASRWS